MAQDFERVLKSSIGTSATEIRAAANSDDAIIGMRFANKGTTAVTVDATVKNSFKILCHYFILLLLFLL